MPNVEREWQDAKREHPFLSRVLWVYGYVKAALTLDQRSNLVNHMAEAHGIAEIPEGMDYSQLKAWHDEIVDTEKREVE